MKIQKIETKNQPTTTTQNFGAIKLRKSNLRMPEALTKDTLNLSKNLPDNAKSKDLKYFGNAEVGGCGGNNNMDDGDVAKAFLIWGAAIAAAALL